MTSMKSTLTSMLNTTKPILSATQQQVLDKLNEWLELDFTEFSNDLNMARTKIAQCVTKRTMLDGNFIFKGSRVHNGIETFNSTVVLSDGFNAASQDYVDRSIETLNTEIEFLDQMMVGYSTSVGLNPLRPNGWDSVNSILYVDVINLKNGYEVPADVTYVYPIVFIGAPSSGSIINFKIFNLGVAFASTFTVMDSTNTTALCTDVVFTTVTNLPNQLSSGANIQIVDFVGQSENSIGTGSGQSHPNIWYNQIYPNLPSTLPPPT